jgi:hypothetical protein
MADAERGNLTRRPQTRLPSAAHHEIANAARWREASPQHGVTPYCTASLYRVPETAALVRRYEGTFAGNINSGAAIDSGRIRRVQQYLSSNHECDRALVS